MVGALEDVKVSVCVVTYNHERYIAQAIESVLAQRTTFPYEIVIGEDCSTDNTRAIVRDLVARYPDRIRLRLADRNQGGKQNFMGTFNDCRGQYVVILEGDDYWTCADKLQLQVEALEAHPNWALCFHPATCVYEDGRQGPELLPESWDRSEGRLEDLFERNFMATSSVLFRNRLFPALPDWFAEISIGDWALHILNAAHGRIGFLPQVMSAYRIHAGGVFSSRSLASKLEETFKMLTAIDHHFGGKYSKAIEANRINTIQWLVGQLDRARIFEAEAVNSRRLVEEYELLTTLNEKRRRSIAYRITRELGRPWRQLFTLMRHWRYERQAAPTPRREQRTQRAA